MNKKMARETIRACLATNIVTADGQNDIDKVNEYMSIFPNYRDSFQLEAGNSEILCCLFDEYNIIALRHSDECADWTVNLDIAKTFGFHRGFYTAARAVYEVLSTYALPLPQPFYLSGHSLGGALASILTFFMKNEAKLLGTYVYGTPHFMNRKARRVFEADSKPYFRLSNCQDLVTFLPLGLGYTQTTNAYRINREKEIEVGNPSILDLIHINPREVIYHHSATYYAECIEMINEIEL